MIDALTKAPLVDQTLCYNAEHTSLASFDAQGALLSASWLAGNIRGTRTNGLISVPWCCAYCGSHFVLRAHTTHCPSCSAHAAQNTRLRVEAEA